MEVICCRQHNKITSSLLTTQNVYKNIIQEYNNTIASICVMTEYTSPQWKVRPDEELTG